MNTTELTAGSGAATATAGPQTASRDKLLSDLRTLFADADEYLRASSGLAGAAYEAARGRFETSLAKLKTNLADKRQAVVNLAETAARTTDDYVRENPWRSIAIGAGAGLMAGLLIGRR